MKKKIDLLDERSDFSKEVLEKTPSWLVSWGSTIFFAFILILLLLSWFIRYPDIIVSQAEITSKNPPINLVTKATGKLKELYVQDGNLVEAGKLLAVIDNPAVTGDVLKLMSLTESPLDSLNQFLPDDLVLGELQPYYSELRELLSAYRVFTHRNPQLNFIQQNDSTIYQLVRAEHTYTTLRDLAKKEYDLKHLSYQRNKELFSSEAISKAELERSESELLQAHISYLRYNTDITNIAQNKRVILKESSSLILDRDKENIRYRTNISNSVRNLRAKLDEWADRFFVIAPVSGRISFFDIWKQNQYISRDRILFSIHPEANSRYFGRLKMPVLNSGKVRVGQKVNIKLKNYPFEEFGILTGKVKSVTSVVNEDYYYAEVTLDNGLHTSYNKQVKPQNLVGEAEIITDDLRLLERLTHTLIKSVKQY
jgi:multidrug resistance efflux pump